MFNRRNFQVAVSGLAEKLTLPTTSLSLSLSLDERYDEIVSDCVKNLVWRHFDQLKCFAKMYAAYSYAAKTVSAVFPLSFNVSCSADRWPIKRQRLIMNFDKRHLKGLYFT